MKQKGFNKIKYYFKVWLSVFKRSLSRGMMYRVEVFVRIFRALFIILSQVIIIKAVLGSSDSFVGWSEAEMYLLVGIFNSVVYISWSVFSVNLWRLEEKIFKGEFDFLLLKPMSSIFVSSFLDFHIDDAVSAISGILFILYYILNNLDVFTIYSVLGGLVTILSAFVIWFSMELIVASFDFIKLRTGIRELKKQLAAISGYPVDVWGSSVKFIFYTFIPLAFVATVPARVLTGVFRLEYVLGSVLIAIVSYLIARTIWYTNLKRYTSGGG